MAILMTLATVVSGERTLFSEATRLHVKLLAG